MEFDDTQRNAFQWLLGVFVAAGGEIDIDEKGGEAGLTPEEVILILRMRECMDPLPHWSRYDEVLHLGPDATYGDAAKKVLRRFGGEVQN